MSYKFQFGPARLSGSTLYKNGLDISGSFEIENPTSLAGDGLVRNGTTLDLNIPDMSSEMTGDVADGDEFAISDAGTMKKVDFSVVRDAVFTDVSGDATIAAGGAVTLAAAQTNVTSLLATDIKIGEDDQTKIDFETADEIHFYAANAEQVFVSDGVFGPETDSDVDLGTSAVRFKDAYVDSVQASGAVNGLHLSASHGLSGSALTLGGVAVTATADELNVLDGLAEGRVLVGDGSGAAAILDASGDGQILVGNGTTITSVSVGGDATLANNGALTIAADAVESGMLNDNVISGQTELLAANIADGDEMLISDGGTLKRVGLASLSTYFGGGAPNKVGNADAALLEGFNYATASIATADRTYTLPASSGLNLGDKVIVKVGQVGPGVAAVVTRAGTQVIDQTETSIRLEEDGAAVTLIYGESDKWFIV